MIAKIVPTAFALDKKTFEEKINMINNFASRIQVDFMDGIFTKNKSISFDDMSIIKNFNKIKFEIHLMVKNPLKYLEDVKNYNFSRALIHFESYEKHLNLIDCIKEYRRICEEVFLVFNPNSDIKYIDDMKNYVDGVMLMGVNPGAEGQELIDSVYEKIKFLKDNYKNLKIEVDGGINDSNILKLKKCGCNFFGIGSYISKSDNPKKSYMRLKDLIK